MKRPVLLACAWICCAVGFVGMVIPVLPTTPLVLLATFLFAKSSPRCHAWIRKTRMYRSYVAPFREQGSIPFKRKLHILGASFTVMGLSAILAPNPAVWAILGAVAVFLLWLMAWRIPTVGDIPAAALVKAREDD